MSATQRNAVSVTGNDLGQPMMFAHGYGCDQNMWRLVAPEFADTYRLVLFDHVGNGKSDLSAYDDERYASLHGYADDVLEILYEQDLWDVIFVGHSVSAMIGVLAANKEPERFARLVLIGPSPRYINEPAEGYTGGFAQADIESLLDSLDANYLGWSSQLAPAIMGNPDRPELAQELKNSFCRTDPDIAKKFARTSFCSDHRADLPRLHTPAVILQCTDDIIAPRSVGDYVYQHTTNSTIVYLNATGHCPNLSAPDETIEAMKAWL